MDELQKLLIEANKMRREGFSLEQINAALQEAKGLDYATLIQTLQDNPFEPEEETLTTENLLRAGAQGASFGFSDEIAGALRAAGALVPGGESPGEAYRGTRDRERAAMDEFRGQHPGYALGAELFGAGAVPGLGTAGIVRGLGAGLGTRVGLGALAGAAGGGLAGAGYAEELEDVPGGVARGASIGGPIGAALPLAGAGLGVLGETARVALGKARPQQTGRALGQQAVRESAQRAQLTPDEFLRRFQAMEDVRPGLAVPADVSAQFGRQVRGELNEAAADIDAIIERVRERPMGAPERLAQDVRDITGRGQSAQRAQAAAQQRVDDLGDALYGSLRDRWPGGDKDPRFQELLDNPDVRAVWNRVRPRQGKAQPELNHFVALRRRLAGQAKAAERAGDSEAARDLWASRAQLTGILESNVPGFRAANQALYTAGERIRAFDRGAQAYKRRLLGQNLEDEMATVLREGGEPALDAFRHGIVDEVVQQISRTQMGSNIGGKLAYAPQEILQAAFDSPQQYEDFIRRALVENQFTTFRNLQLGNSTTSAQAMDLLRSARTTAFWSAQAAFLNWLSKVSPEVVQARANEVARLLLTSTPQNADEVARIIAGPNSLWTRAWTTFGDVGQAAGTGATVTGVGALERNQQ